MKPKVISLILSSVMLLTLFAPLSVCSEEMQTYEANYDSGKVLAGDVNGDGKINLRDVVLLYRHIIGVPTEIIEESLDIDGDGTVTIADAYALFHQESGHGDTIDHNHEHKLISVAAKEPTLTENGNIAYYYCSGCGDMFIDSLAQTLIDPENTVIYANMSSVGLAFTLNEDGAGYFVTGIGTCTDTEVVIPAICKGLPVIGICARAFRACESLTSVTIPNSVTSIGIGAFASCSSLTTISVDKDNTVYSGVGNCIIETATKELIAGCKTSIIPTDGSVTVIGECSFYECDEITSINIPAGVTTIGENAFYNCSNLTSIVIPNSVTNIGNSVVGRCSVLNTTYYIGSEAEWNLISIGSGNEFFETVKVYYYSESTPTVDGDFWHYVDGQPTPWVLRHIHTEVIDSAVAPTCEKTGLSEGKHCSVCNEILVAQQIVDIIGHDYSIHESSVCTKEECKLFHKCSFCGFSLLIPLEKRYFVKQLTQDQRENFVTLYNEILACNDDLIELPNRMTNPDQDVDILYTLLYFSCPELVQLSTNNTGCSYNSSGIRFTLIMDTEEFANYCKQLFTILCELNEVTKGMSDWEKSTYVYEYVIEKTTYEALHSDANNAHEGSCLGPLLAGKARCQGYVNAYEICMWAVGLECYAVTGVAGPNNGGHAWNITNFDGNYYLSDPTWDDNDDGMNYAYFNVSTDMFYEHTLDPMWNLINMPTCNKTDMSYFEITNSFIAADEDLKIEFIKILQEHYPNNVILFRTGTMAQAEALVNNSTYFEYLKEWARSNGISFKSSRITYWNILPILEITINY